MECWYDGYDEYSYAEHVVCPGNQEYEYCDCRSDCGAYFEGTYQGYCECSEAQADDCCGSWTGEYYHGGYGGGDPYFFGGNWYFFSDSFFGDWYGERPPWDDWYGGYEPYFFDSWSPYFFSDSFFDEPPPMWGP